MSISTIMRHLDESKKELCFRKLDNLRNQGTTVAELRSRCAQRGWRCIERPDRVLIAKTESAFEEALGQSSLPIKDPNEIIEPELVPEAAKQSVIVNRYERNASARAKCIAAWGLSCAVCSFNFEAVYGSRGAGYIHVHHLKPLSEIRQSYQLDPVNDLRPVCPNCHAMLHATRPAASIEELKEVMRRAGC